MATLKEWEGYFKTLSGEELEDLEDALRVLTSDKMIKEEFKGMGLTDLLHSAMNIGDKKVKS